MKKCKEKMKAEKLEKVYSIYVISYDTSRDPSDNSYIVTDSKVFRNKEDADKYLAYLKRQWDRLGYSLVGGIDGPNVYRHPSRKELFETFDYRMNYVREKFK